MEIIKFKIQKNNTGFSWNLLTIMFGDVVDLFVRYESTHRHNQTTDSEFMKEIYTWSGRLFVLWLVNAVLNYCGQHLN